MKHKLKILRIGSAHTQKKLTNPFLSMDLLKQQTAKSRLKKGQNDSSPKSNARKQVNDPLRERGGRDDKQTITFKRLLLAIFTQRNHTLLKEILLRL